MKTICYQWFGSCKILTSCGFKVEQEDFTKAILLNEKGVATIEKVFGKSHEDTIAAYHNFATLLHELGAIEQAIVFHRKAIRQEVKLYDKFSINLGQSYYELASAYYLLPDYQKALSYLQKAYSIYKKGYGDGHQDTIAIAESIRLLKD